MVVLNQAKNTPIFSTAERPLRRLGGKAHGLASSSPKFLDLSLYLSHTIHLWYIYTYIYHTNQLNVGTYISPIDPMGIDWVLAPFQ